jgi:hypothetical protein
MCRQNVMNKQHADAAGDDAAERHKAFHKWVHKNIQCAILAGVNALELHRDRERAGARSFLPAFWIAAYEVDVHWQRQMFS